MASELSFNPKMLENLGRILLSNLEAETVQALYWMSRSMQQGKYLSENISQRLDSLNLNSSHSQRNLEQRLQVLEENSIFRNQDAVASENSALTEIENRLQILEESLGKVALLTKQLLSQQSQTLQSFEQRLVDLETLRNDPVSEQQR